MPSGTVRPPFKNTRSVMSISPKEESSTAFESLPTEYTRQQGNIPTVSPPSHSPSGNVSATTMLLGNYAKRTITTTSGVTMHKSLHQQQSAVSSVSSAAKLQHPTPESVQSDNSMGNSQGRSSLPRVLTESDIASNTLDTGRDGPVALPLAGGARAKHNQIASAGADDKPPARSLTRKVDNSIWVWYPNPGSILSKVSTIVKHYATIFFSATRVAVTN